MTFKMLTRIAVILSFGTLLVHGAIDASVQKTYADSMTDFTQDFLAVAMKEQGEKNFVFSPFSMHSVLAMLTSGSTDNSTTQKELLNGFGRANVIANIEQLYEQFVNSYKGTDVEKNLKFGNRMWTTPRYFPKIDDEYKSKLENLYGAKFAKFAANNPEKEVNDWVKEVTQGKIDKIVGKLSYFFFFNRSYSLLSFRLPQRMLILIHINSEALPITYSVCCVLVELAEKLYNP